MTRASDDLPLKKIVENLFKEQKLEGKYIATKIPTIWADAVGKYIAERTTKIFVKNGVLYVFMSSGPLKQEMSHNKGKLISLVNQSLGSDYIKSIEIR